MLRPRYKPGVITWQKTVRLREFGRYSRFLAVAVKNLISNMLKATAITRNRVSTSTVTILSKPGRFSRMACSIATRRDHTFPRTFVGQKATPNKINEGQIKNGGRCPPFFLR
jgi:hypothetical protein